MADRNNSTWYDRFLERWAPAAALRREVARTAIAEVRNSYRGGLATRISTGWDRSTTDRFGRRGDQHRIMSMRERAQQADKDNPIARTLLDTEVENVIADGMTLQARTDSKAFNDEADEKFAEWLDTADIYGQLSGGGLQRLFYRSCRRDGDGGILLTELAGNLKLQVIPARHIKNPITKFDVRILDGIEVDQVGRRLRFYVETIDEEGRVATSTVAARDLCYFAPNLTDASQIRPPTCFDTVFTLLDQADAYLDAVIIAARMAAIFGLVFKEASGAKSFGGLDYLTNSKGNQQRALTLENGMVRWIGQQDEIVQVQATQPMQQTPDFVRAMLRMIGMPFSMPLELIAKDMSTVNFASARIGLLGFYRACRVRQCEFAHKLGQVYRWWVSKSVIRGDFVSAVPEEFWPHEFVPRGWDYTDPVSEVQSDMLQIAAGLKSPHACAMERGRDLDQIQLDIAAFRELREANDLPNVQLTLTRDELPEPAEPASQPTDPNATPQQDNTDGETDQEAA